MVRRFFATNVLKQEHVRVEEIAGDRMNIKRIRHELLSFGKVKETARSQVGRMDYVDAPSVSRCTS